MPAKTASTADFRPALRQAYLIAFDGFSTDAAEVAKTLDIDAKTARKILDRLERAGIATSLHVNDEPTLTFQASETYDSISRSTALRRFDKAFPKGEPVALDSPKTGRKGVTGPRYSDAQIRKGLAARKAGKTNREVAEAAGVKSPNYFAKTLKAVEAATPKRGKSAGNGRTAKRAGAHSKKSAAKK